MTEAYQTADLTQLVHRKVKLSFLWLRSAWQASAQLHATIYDKRQERTPRESASHAETHEFTEVIVFLTTWGFLLLVFSPRSAATYVPLPKLCPRVTTWWCSDTRRCLLNSSCHQHFLPRKSYGQPLCQYTPSHCRKAFQLISTPASFRPKTRGAMRSRRDNAGDR